MTKERRSRLRNAYNDILKCYNIIECIYLNEKDKIDNRPDSNYADDSCLMYDKVCSMEDALSLLRKSTSYIEEHIQHA